MFKQLYRFLAVTFLLLSHVFIHAQEERFLNEFKVTIYSKVAGQEGSNINLSLLLFEKNINKLVINGFSGGTEFTDTVKLHELSELPVQNIIVSKLKSHSIGTAAQTASDILESQSISTINSMVMAAKASRTTENKVDRDSITSRFTFHVKIPIYVNANSKDIQDLFKLVGYSPQEREADSLVLENQINSLVQQRNQYADFIGKMPSGGVNQMETAKYNETRKKLSEVSDEIQEKKQELVLFQGQTSKSKDHYLAGFAFVKKNEVVINRGFIKAIKMTLEDSIELRYRFGGGKVPLTRFKINKIIDYVLSLDIRSVSSAHRSLEKYTALWKFSRTGVDFWTRLSQVIEYDAPDDGDITDLFVVKQQRIIFDAGKPNVIRVPETDVNHVVQLNIFTDLIGVQEDQPNGLIQVEGAFRLHFLAWIKQSRYRQWQMYFFDHIDANLRFAKIENKLRYLDAGMVKGGTQITFIPNFQLLQYANLETGVKVSAFRFVSYKRDFNLYYGAGILRTGLRDTLFEESGTETTKIPRVSHVLTLMQSIQAHMKIKATSYMGVDISARFIWLRLMDKDVRQSGGNYSREANSFEEFSKRKNVLFNPQFQVYYMPNKDESKRLYLRCGFTHDIGTKSNNFLSIQVGLSSDIQKFLNFSGTK
jgi:hypothetical protein